MHIVEGRLVGERHEKRDERVPLRLGAEVAHDKPPMWNVLDGRQKETPTFYLTRC